MHQNSRPLVSVVVPAYCRTELLRRAVLSLLQQDLPKENYEVIVVDSSPDDRNVVLINELVAEAQCSVQCLAKKPEGPGPSRNLGVSRANADVIAFMDSDCEASAGWLRAGLAGFTDGVGLVQGRTLPDSSARQSIFSHYLSVEQESFFYETANIFYLKEAFEASGGFPVDLRPNAQSPMGGEDTTVAWSVIRLGWETRFGADALVHHAIVPLSPWQWLFIYRLFCIPKLIRRFPELRRFMAYTYFFDRGQAFFALALLGILLSWKNPWTLIFCLPYAAFRASEPTKSLAGVLRPLRIIPYFFRDVFSFVILSLGSIKYRSLLL